VTVARASVLSKMPSIVSHITTSIEALVSW